MITGIMDNTAWLWTGFNIFVVISLIIDLGVFNRKAHVIKFKEALLGSAVWVGFAMVFMAGLFTFKGEQAGLDFLTGYLIELSLSVDNLFVFLLIFNYFKVPSHHQHKVLFWGIFGAIVMRILFIFIGVAAINRFHWIIYIFGAFLIFTGFKLAMEKEKEIHPENNPVVKFFKKYFRVTDHSEDGHFFVRKNGAWMATPFFIVLLVVETTDVIFALDSIPAIIAITKDPFIIYSSNVFAILGLRQIYFALAGMMNLFRFLNVGLAIILIFIGIKMVGEDFIHIPTSVALGVVAGVLSLSIAASLIFKKKIES